MSRTEEIHPSAVTARRDPTPGLPEKSYITIGGASDTAPSTSAANRPGVGTANGERQHDINEVELTGPRLYGVSVTRRRVLAWELSFIASAGVMALIILFASEFWHVVALIVLGAISSAIVFSMVDSGTFRFGRRKED